MAASDYVNAINHHQPETPTTLIHIVDIDANFCSTTSDISKFLKSHSLLDRGTDYSVVGIVGAQSSGKSTLLNMLFGTRFEELNSQFGRQMTTKGIWLGASPKVPKVLVMDLEGTDSVTRQTERHPFERQSAMLALTVAEVVIVNMWHHDVGRYVASNYGVLATVFEVNLALVADDLRKNKAQKTLLLFTIRDHAESESPLSVIARQLTDDMDHIWADMKMPQGLEHLEFSSMFDIEFVSLPHKKFESQKFADKVDLLRQRFSDPSCDDYLFGTNSRIQKVSSVPASGLPHYMETIWDTILSNSELNLPSQKEMLAIFRCDELFGQIQQGIFQKQIAPIQQQLKTSYISSFRDDVLSVIQSSLSEFDHAASGFDPVTVAKKRIQFEDRLRDLIQPLWSQQLVHGRGKCLTEFQCGLESALPSRKSCERFGAIVTELRHKSHDTLRSIGHQSSIHPDNHDDSNRYIEMVIGQLNTDIDVFVGSQREIQLSRLSDEMSQKIRHQLIGQCARIFELCQPDMWSHINDAIDVWINDILDGIITHRLPSIGVSSSRAEQFRADHVTLTLGQLHEEASKHAQFVKQKMARAFDVGFRLDPSGLPRQWHQERDIRKCYIDARDKAIVLLDLFAKFDIDLSHYNITSKSNKKLFTPLLSESLRESQRNEFLRGCEDALESAESSRSRSLQLTSTPSWVLPLIAVLGFNEAMTILQHPILLFFLIICSIGIFMIWYMNMTGPAFAMAKLFIRQLTASVSAALDAHHQLPQPHPPSLSPIESTNNRRHSPNRSPNRRRSKSPQHHSPSSKVKSVTDQ